MKKGTDRSLAAIKERLTKIGWPWRHEPERFRLLKVAASMGDAEAAEDLGIWYRDGDVVPKGRAIVRPNVRESIRYFRQAAEAGGVAGMVGLADALTLPYFNKNPPASRRALDEGIRWYQRAGQAGLYNLGITYRYLGSHAKAVACFRRAARIGSATELMEVARAELYGVGTKRDVPAALAKLRRIAAMGRSSEDLDHVAMVMLAKVYFEGWFVRRDSRTARSWLLRAAKAGSHSAEGLLEDWW